MGPSVGIGFAVFNFVQPLVLARMHNCDRGHCKSGRHHYNPEHVLLASTIAGSASGFVSKSVTYPFDLAKRRMQISVRIFFLNFILNENFLEEGS